MLYVMYVSNFNVVEILFDIPDEELPVFGTIASQFNDQGTNVLFANLMKIVEKKGWRKLGD